MTIGEYRKLVQYHILLGTIFTNIHAITLYYYTKQTEKTLLDKYTYNVGKPRDCRRRLYYCHTSVETKHGFTRGTTLSLHLCPKVVTEYINN